MVFFIVLDCNIDQSLVSIMVSKYHISLVSKVLIFPYDLKACPMDDMTYLGLFFWCLFAW
jgi:hypothetical protein